MKTKIITYFLSILLITSLTLIPFSNSHNTENKNSSTEEGYYLKHLSESDFTVGDSQTVINYRCSYGGVPLAIWGAKINEEIDSLKDIPLLYLKEGYKASDLQIDLDIKTNFKSNKGLHLTVQNPANGQIRFELSRPEKEFYASTALLAPKLSDYSEQIVSNYEILTDNSNFLKLNPTKEQSFVAAHGVFLYEMTKSVSVTVSVWDQLTGWSNFFNQNQQDIYLRIAPNKYEENFYEGYGFWICGEDEKIEAEIIPELKKKKDFYNIDTTNLTENVKKEILYSDNYHKNFNRSSINENLVSNLFNKREREYSNNRSSVIGDILSLNLRKN